MSYKTDVPLAGVWEGDFVSATNEAARLSKPVLLVMGNAHCPCCNYLTDTALNSARFLSWSQERDLIQVHVLYNENPVAAFDWVRKHSGPMIYFPSVGIYWPQANKTTEVCFTGRDGEMPVKAGSLVEQLIGSIEEKIADYGKATRWSFACGDTVGNRLEAETNVTRRVAVPLTRETNLGQASTCRLAVAWPKDVLAPVTNDIAWAVGQTETNVWVETVAPPGTALVGEALELKLLGEKGEVQATTHITFVEPMKNSPVNPQWIGEPFAFGKLTFDYDAATNAVAKKRKAGERAYLIAFWTGALWCPYCKGIETSLMADPRFYDWAASNNVALVEFDQGRASSPATAAGTLSPRLTTYEPDPRLGAAETVSGAPYLSRHAVDPADTVAVRARTTAFTQKWLAPGSTAARLSQPTLLLIGQDEQVLGRLSAARDDAKVYDVAENIARLNDLLKLADRADESGDYALTTREIHAVGVEEEAKTNAVVQINRKNAAFVLDGLEAGALTLTATAGGKDVKIQYVLDGVVKETANNKLSVKVAKSHLTKKAVVVVSGSEFASGGNTAYPVELTSLLEPAKIEEASSVPSLFTLLQMIEELILEEKVASVTVKKTSGTLPLGVRLAYDADSEAICLKGYPSRPGDYAVSYSYTVKYISGETETSEPTEVSIRVFDPAERNAYLGEAQNRTVPMLDDGGKLVGTLAFSSTSRGLLSAKFIGERVVSFAGRWQELDDEGRASAILERTKGETLSVQFDAEGTLWAAVSGGVFGDGISGFAEEVDTTNLSGSYTATLVNLGTDANQLGHGQLRLNTVGYCCDPGVRAVLYYGKLPDGRSFSGSASLVGGGSDGVYGFVQLPIFKKVGASCFGAVLSIRERGWETYQDDEDSGARIIYAAEGTIPYWGDRLLQVYGSYFDWMPLSWWSEIYAHLAPTYALKIGGVKVATIVPQKDENLVEKTADAVSVTFRYVPRTGEIGGLANFKFGSENVSGNWKAIAVPGWHYDCGCTSEDIVVLPLAMGSFTFTDRSTGTSVLRSLPVTLEPIED